MSRRIPHLIASAASVILLWLFLSSPGSPAVTTECAPSGLLNRARALIQGERFWHSAGRDLERQSAEMGLDPSAAPCRAMVFERAGMPVFEPLLELSLD